MTLRLITAPTVEPVSTATAKAFLRVDGTDDDALIESLIKAAREKGEGLARRAFITQELEQIFDDWPTSKQLKLWRPPLQSVTSVKYRDGDNVEHTWTDYVVDTRSEPGVVIFDSYPSDGLLESGAITVRFTAGYGDAADNVPEAIKQAILLLVAYWYETRDLGGAPRDIQAMFVGERVVWF
jgi:uncharacterized phiE125 gp8 family phage protein